MAETRRTFYAADDSSVVIITDSQPSEVVLNGRQYFPNKAQLGSSNIDVRVAAIQKAADDHDREVLQSLKYDLMYDFVVLVSETDEPNAEICEKVFDAIRIRESFPDQTNVVSERSGCFS